MTGTDPDPLVFATGAKRSKEVIPAWSDIPDAVLERVALIYLEGRTKYGRYNYKHGFPVHVLWDHARQHISRYRRGDRSEDHLAKAVWGLIQIMDQEATHPELDDWDRYD